ncbi:MAG: hypothetical protein ITG01_08020 [Comamonas sp.]|nr:hypothetical protein [Comamonas sp.]
MFGWLRKLFASAKEHAAMLEMLEKQASTAKEQLNQSLQLAHSSTSAEVKVLHLEFAKSKFAELQAVAAVHPRMRLTNEEEIDAAIKQMEDEFSRAGYYAMARQSASAHVSLSSKAKELLR